MNVDAIVVTASGMVTPVGIDAISSGASFRAGLIRSRELAYFSSYVGAENMELPVVGNLAATQAEGAERFGKMLTLGAGALRDLAASARTTTHGSHTRASFLVSIPNYLRRQSARGNGRTDPEQADELEALAVNQARFEEQCDRHLGDRLLEIADFPLQIETWRNTYGDACSFLELVGEAVGLLEAGKVDCCVVGGIDSYVEPSTLEWAIEHERIRLEGGSSGFSPGEGAAFIQLERHESARRRGAQIEAMLARPSFGREYGKGGHSEGEGLASAVRRAVAIQGAEIGLVMGNLNGTLHSAREWGKAIIRLNSDLPDLGSVQIRYPAESVGETGCACMPIAIGFGIQGYRRAYVSEAILVWCIGDGDVRGALVLHRGDGTPAPVRTTILGAWDEAFLKSLYLEHLEEASFLYEQRIALLDDPELTWRDLHDFEERLEAHVDALVLGGDLALEVCRQQAAEGDFGELHAAVRVFCRHDRPDLFDEAFAALDGADTERLTAVTDALCHELPRKWAPAFVKRLADGNPSRMRTIARPPGYRRIPVAQVLAEALPNLEQSVIPDVVWSLGRLRDSSTRSILYKHYLQHENERVQAAAALALLRIGEPAATGYCADVARHGPWALVPIGLSGGRAHLELLMDVAASDHAGDECMLALGLLGDISAVEPLLYHLSDEAMAESASVALYLISGAELFEEVLVPEPIDEDELFEDELEELQQGANGTAEMAETRGTPISRLSRDPHTWREWWSANRASFKPGVRYRNGRPYDPKGLLQNLASEQSPRIVRRLAAEELAIRYGCDVEFETDMFVASQIRALADMNSWFEHRSGKYEPGEFYMAGVRQSR